ncbi:hypothetical protein TGME49_220110 [Toxoplasma gondii ME49]|uniref:Uncharacterized protein n=1 Tax=Toxoplasma gondii (strain ATCC 50611 / Me49) TaxID=508771 RepID=S8F8N2_TOXGM|nr:hypothetical protein TGME49_220110 [Toxoplasma gondii ME49]EPT31107.1 hypothetical protein TGME49_220110 [Toxoplasma gondii ME49]|eukprot:XP_018637821.1 hypothetical protein TGME49_220110 [Toxoplasma gondii ME49]
MEQKKSPPSSVEAPFERGRERPCPSSAGAGGSFVTVWRQVLERGGALRPSSGCLRASPDGQYLACSTGGTSLCVLDAVGVTDPARRLPFSGHGSAVVSVLLPHHHPSSSSASSSQWRLSDAQGSAPETDASSACSVSTGSGGHEAATAEIFRMLRGASAVPENRRFRCFSWSPPLLSRYGPRLVKQNLDLCACLLCTATRDGNVALWGVPSRRMPLQQRLSLLCDLSQRWHASLDHQPADPSAGQAHSRRGDPGPSAERSRLIVSGTGIESQPLCYWWTYGEEEHRPLHTATPGRCDPDDGFGKKTEADSPSGISDAQACRREAGNVPSRAADFPQGNSFSRRAGSRHEGDPPLAPRIPVFKEGGVLDLAACAKDPRIRSWHDPLVTFSPGAVLLPIIRCEYGRKTGHVERSQADGILQEGEKASETAPRSDTGSTRRESVGVREGGGEQAGSSCKSSRHETELSRFCDQPGSERCGENASLGGSGVQRPGVCFFARKDGDLQVEVDSARGCLCAVAGPHAISIFWLSNRQTALRFCANRETPPRVNEETIDTRVSWKRRGSHTEASEMQTATAAEGGSSSADGISVAETGFTTADLIEKCQREAANMRGGKRRKIPARNGIECLSKTAGPWRTAAKPRVADGEEAQEGHEARDDRTDAGMATHETGNAGGAPREGDSREDTKEHRGRRGETGASLESDDEREATEAEDADRLRTASTRAVGSASDARGGRPMRACRSRAPFRVIDSSDDESSDGREAAQARGDTHAKRKSEKRRKESEGGKIAKGKELNKASNEGCEVRGPGRKRKRKAVSSDDDIYDGESTPESSSDEDDFDEESTDESEVAEEDSEDEDRGRYGKKKARGGAKGKKTSTHKGAKAEGRSKGSTDSRNAPQSRCARPEPHQPRTWRQLTLPAQHAEAQRLLSAAAEAQRPHDGTPKKGESEDRDAREPYVLLVQVLLMPGMSESSEDSPQQGWEPNWRRQTISDIALTPLTVEATSLLHPQGDGRRSEECDLDCEAQDESMEVVQTTLRYQVLATTCNGALLAFPCGLVVRSRNSRFLGSVPGDDVVLQIVRCSAATPQLLLPSVGMPAVHLHVQSFLPFFGPVPPKAFSRVPKASTATRANTLEAAAHNETDRQPRSQDGVGDVCHATDVTSKATPWLWAVCACGERVRAVVFDGDRWCVAPQSRWRERSEDLRAECSEVRTNPEERVPPACSPSGRLEEFSVTQARETSGLNAREVSRRGRQDKLCVRGGAPVVASFASLVPLNHVPPDVWDASSPCLPALQCCGASPFSPVEKDMWLPQATVYAVDSFGVTVSYVLGSLTRGGHASPSGLHRGQSLDLCWTLVHLSQSACSIETDQEGSLLRPLACGARPRITRHDNLDMLDGQSAHEDRYGARVYGPEFRAEPGTTGATEHSASVATVYAEAAREAGLFVKEAYSLEGTSRGQTHVRDSELRGPRDERGSKFEESSRDSSEKNSTIFPGGKQLLEDDQKNLGVLLSEMRGRSAHQLQVMQQLGKLRPRSMQGQDQQRQRRGGTACGRSSVLSLAVSSSGALLFSLTLHQQAYLHIAVAPLAASATELLLLGWQRQCQETSAALFGLLSQVSLKRAGLPTHPAKTICGPCEALDIIPEGKQKRASSLPETCKEIGDGATLSCWRNQEPFARATHHGSVRMSCGSTLAPALPRAALEAVDAVPLWELAFSLCGPKQPVWSSRPASASEAGGATGRKRRRGHLQSSGMSSRFAWEDAELDEGILSADCLQEPESCAGFSGDEETVEQPVCCSSISLSSEGGEWLAGNWGVETNGKSGREARGAVSSLLTQEREERKGEWDDLLKRFLGQGNTGLCMRGDGAVSWGASVKPRDFPSAAADLLRVAFLQAVSQRSLGGTVSAASNCGAPESVNALMDCHSSSDQQQSAGVALDMGGCPLTRCDSDACAVRPSAFMGDSEDASKFCVQPREVDLRGRVLLGALLLAVDSITSRFSFQRRLTAAIRSAGLAAVAMSRSAGSKGACSLVCLLRHLKRNVDGLQRRDCGSSTGAAAPDTSVEFPGSGKASHGGQDRDRPPRCYSGTATAVVDVVGSEAKHFVEQHCGENCYLSKWAGLLWHWERVTSLASSCFLTVPPVCSGGESIGNIIRCEGFTSAGDALIASGAQHVVELHMQVVDRLCLLQRLIAIISLCRPPLPVGSMSSRGTEYDAPMRRGPYSNSTSPPLTEPSQARSSLSGTVMQNALVPYHANSASPMNTEACGTAARETEEIAGCSKPAPDVPGALRDTLLEILKNLWGLSKCSKAEIDSRVLQEGDPLSGSQMAAKWLCQGLYAGAFRILPHFPDLFQVQRLCGKASVGGFSGRGSLGREKPFRAEEREETCVNGSPEISAGVDVTHASSELDTTVGDTKVSEGPGSVTAIYSCLICGTEAQLVFFKRDAANSRRREFSMQGPGQPEQNTEQHESCVGAGDHLATSFWRCPAKDDVDDCMQGMLPVEREWGHQNMWLQIGSAISGGGAGFSCPLCRGDLRRSA